MSPRNPTDDREAPYCRRCGEFAEPDDYYCWSCGGEEEILAGETVPHVYMTTPDDVRAKAARGVVVNGRIANCRA